MGQVRVRVRVRVRVKVRVRVGPGEEASEKMSSEVMQCSLAPGTSG